MDYKSIQELIKTMSESNLTTLEIESDDLKIKLGKEQIIKTNGVINKDIEINGVEEIQRDNNEVAIEIAPKTEPKIEVEGKSVEENLYIVKSPIVGTFYESSTPGSEAFVKVGSKISIGDTLCIVEAMKLMNDIASDVDGEIVEILVENEEMVEYGQELFKVRV